MAASRRLQSLQNHLVLGGTGPPKLDLHYFQGRGIGELIRLILEIGGLDFQDHRYSMQEYVKADELKAQFPFGQMPTIGINGIYIGQTLTIGRTCARLCGLYPMDPVEAGISDMVVDHTQEIHSTSAKLSVIGVPGSPTAKKLPPDELKKAQADFAANKLPGMLAKLEALLEGKEFFAEGRLTWADIALFNRANAMLDIDATCLDNFPGLRRVRDHIRAMPAVDAWIQKWAELYPNHLSS